MCWHNSSEISSKVDSCDYIAVWTFKLIENLKSVLFQAFESLEHCRPTRLSVDSQQWSLFQLAEYTLLRFEYKITRDRAFHPLSFVFSRALICCSLTCTYYLFPGASSCTWKQRLCWTRTAFPALWSETQTSSPLSRCLVNHSTWKINIVRKPCPTGRRNSWER